MGLFSKKEKAVIPEPERPGNQRGSSATASVPRDKKGNPVTEVRDRRYGGREAPAYNPQATAGSYGSYGNYGNNQQQAQGQGPAGSYGSNPAGSYNASPAGNNNDARAALFKGAKAPGSKTGTGFDDAGRPAGQPVQENKPEWADDGDETPAAGEQEQRTEEDDEVEAIKQQIRFTKQESLSTTRNAIQTAREAEETATNTLTRLGEQTDRIANTELALDKAKGYNSRAADGAKEIRRLNQSIFKPQISFNKEAKRDAQEAKMLARHIEEKNEREEARSTAYASRQRVEQGFKEAERSGRNKGDQPTGRAKWEQGGRYQFEASNSDDEIEQELDSNLDEISAITGRLKILATTAGKEIDAQNKHLDKIGGKVDTLDDKIVANTAYLKRSELLARQSSKADVRLVKG